MSKAFKGTVCALLAGIVWGTMSIFVENLKGVGVSTMSIVFLRTTITTVFLGFFLALFKPKLLKINIKTCIYLIAKQKSRQFKSEGIFT